MWFFKSTIFPSHISIGRLLRLAGLVCNERAGLDREPWLNVMSLTRQRNYRLERKDTQNSPAANVEIFFRKETAEVGKMFQG